MSTTPTTGAAFKRGDSVKLQRGLHGRVEKLLDVAGTRTYRIRIKCPSPKPIYLDEAEDQLELIRRQASKPVAKPVKRAIPRAFQNEELSGVDFEHILGVARGEGSGRGILQCQTASIPTVD